MTTERQKRFWKKVRSRILPAHPYVGQTHCRSCKAEFGKLWMRNKRKLDKEAR